MAQDRNWLIVARGTWLYDGAVLREIELLARPVVQASSRWIEEENTGELVVDNVLRFRTRLTV